ncbi:YgaP family membrane protein [Congregibacter sp.]|uniref:YgaP family membrane protein n=1 Tax=Congregibacter sp. TaxID=2744308 RepID=UPI003F6A95B4
MIDRNIGTLERIVRFTLAVALIAWILSAERFGVAQGVAVLAAFALLWNSIFGRCYLWKWLGLSSCSPEDDCSAGGGDSPA